MMLPQNLEAERDVLGACLFDARKIDDVAQILTEDDFAHPRNGKVFATILKLRSSGDAVTAVTVVDAISRNQPEMRTDIKLHVTGLMDAGTSGALEAARIIADLAHLRRLAIAGEEVSNLACSEPDDVGQAVAACEWKILSTRPERDEGDVKVVGEATAEDSVKIEEAGKAPGGLIGIATGMPTLDRITHGWQPGQLVVFGAQTGMGKTTLLLRFAAEAAAAGRRVLLVSLEMTGEELRHRLYSQTAHIRLDAIQTGNGVDWEELHRRHAEMDSWQLVIDARPKLTVADIASSARRWAQKWGGLDLVAVDYLQRVKVMDNKVARYEQVEAIAHDLKDLAKTLACPVLTAAQLNDKTADRKDKTPMMGDLRESRGIEHTADIIAFGYWPWRHDHEEHGPTEYDLIIAKHRQGAPDVVIDCDFDAPYNLISESRRLHAAG